MLPIVYFSLFILSLAFITKLVLQRGNTKNLPPGPPTLPIIGHLHLVKSPFHRSLHSLSKTYGPIFSLKLGSRISVVISSYPLAQQCFTKHDITLANRPRTLVGKHVLYNYQALAAAPYGEHWRNVRRITSIDVLSNHRLNTFSETRRDEVLRVLGKLVDDTCQGFTKVQLRPRMTEMSFNNVLRMVSGKKCYDDDNDKTSMGSEEARKFRDIISEIIYLLGANNIGDILPIFRWFVFFGFVKRLKRVGEECDDFAQRLIEEHRSGKHSNNNSMIEHLLSLQKEQPEYYSDFIVKGIIQDMLVAGTDTTAYTIEWAMSALLNNPNVLKKAKHELDTCIGQDRLIEESDVSNLPYLQNIVNETLRLFAPAPLLLPHLSADECNIGGYTIPRDTTVLVNAWVIHRDPTIWGDDAECFKPERFEKEGEADKLMAFGLGRRACPGNFLAHRVMGLALGLLIQCFEWKRTSDEEIDMMELDGAATPKLIPLEAMCKALPISNKLKSY